MVCCLSVRTKKNKTPSWMVNVILKWPTVVPHKFFHCSLISRNRNILFKKPFISKYTKFFQACRSFHLATEDNKLNKAASLPACCGKTISYVLHVKNSKLFNFGDKFVHMVICMVVNEIATESIKSKREMKIIWEISWTIHRWKKSPMSNQIDVNNC